MHPKYWKRRHVLRAPIDGEGSAGAGGESFVDAFASHFENSASDDDNATSTPVAESQEDTAARLAAEDAASAQTTEQPSADTPADAAAKPDKFTVEVDGKPIELTSAEMAEHVKNGMRQADYSRKTAELAEQRRTTETQQAEARAQRDDYAAKLQNAYGIANYEVAALRGQLTDQLLQSDPVSYLQIQRTVEQRQAQLQQADVELRQINEQRTQEKAQADHQNATTQREQLLAKVPEWKDTAKATTEVQQLKKYLTTQGYDQGEADFTDHRSVVLARKAMQYDALMERAKGAQTKVAAAPAKVERPGTPATSSTDGRTKAMRDLAATGSRDAAAAVFADLFG